MAWARRLEIPPFCVWLPLLVASGTRVSPAICKQLAVG